MLLSKSCYWNKSREWTCAEIDKSYQSEFHISRRNIYFGLNISTFWHFPDLFVSICIISSDFLRFWTDIQYFFVKVNKLGILLLCLNTKSLISPKTHAYLNKLHRSDDRGQKELPNYIIGSKAIAQWCSKWSVLIF